MFKKILVPTDGSPMALQAAKYARTMAEKFDGEVTLIHVVQNYYNLPAFSMPDTLTIPMSVLSDLEANGRLILAKTKEIFSGFNGKLSTRLEYGPPAKQVVDVAIEEHYSLIVMGCRGLGSLTGLLLGSVSNHVIHYASCPTLIVKGPETD